MHIDAASGGFVFPFSHPDFKWDFRLDSVVSINASGHKFGLVYPGIGWLVTRTDAQVPEELIFYEDYLGQKDATFTLNFSGSSSFVLAQYYQFLRLGHSGYSTVVGAMWKNRETLAQKLRELDAITVFDDERPTLPLLIARTKDKEPFDSNDLVGDLAKRRGWMIPAYQLPANNENDRIMRMLVKLNQTRELVDALAEDFSASIDYLRSSAAGNNPTPPVHTGHGY